MSSLGRASFNLEKIRPSMAESQLDLEIKVACAGAIVLRSVVQESLKNDPATSKFLGPSKIFSLKRESLAAQLLMASHSLSWYSTFEVKAWATNLYSSSKKAEC